MTDAHDPVTDRHRDTSSTDVDPLPIDVDSRSRRAAVATIGSLGAGVLAGCLDRGGVKGDGSGTGTGGSESVETHPATNAIEGSPTLGPEPGTAEATIVEFGDPSCSTCAAFASSTFPKLRENAIDPGRVSYVWRALPGVEPWGRPAARALWAVQLADPEGFWRLKAWYYDERASISEDTVRDRTEEALVDGEVSTDARVDRVLAAIDDEDETVRERLERDERAGKETDFTGVPAFVLFRDGEHVTTVLGNQPYGVFEGALGL
ncbi:DsbA family protein [Halopenitus salinus]|uniref:DsbA family protein n=1 Tax=Halopenitus salinus TaxID=1198295 RepID=A0ABD5UUA1_9EURY